MDKEETSQETWDSKPTHLDGIEEEEPTDDRGVRNVLVSSSSSRAVYHKQDIHNEGQPACGQQLAAEHSEWTDKPKGAMERSGTEACPKCYEDGGK